MDPSRDVPLSELVEAELIDYSNIQSKLKLACEKVATILDSSRKPQFPSLVPHKYEDKYFLVEHVGKISILALLTCFEYFNVNRKEIEKLKEWSTNKSV